MDMKRKKLVLAVSAAVLLGGYTVGIFGQTEGDLTQKQIENPNTLENKEDIAKSVLESTGRSGQYDLQDLGDVTVYLGSDVTGNPQDAIVTVSFGPKNTVVAAYTADGNVYEYTGDLGDFYGVQNIRFVPVPELKKEIVIVREQVNQSLGSFEQSDILRGYVFDGKEYQDVLNTPQKIESSWNNLWNKGELQEPSLWRRVTGKKRKANGLAEMNRPLPLPVIRVIWNPMIKGKRKCRGMKHFRKKTAVLL